MATLTITHHDNDGVRLELRRLIEGNGGIGVSSDGDTTVATFDSEDEARSVATVLDNVTAVTRATVE